MDRHPKLRADGSAEPGRGNCLFWFFIFLGLMAWQGWMTLTLFGPNQARQRLLDDQPILSGRHPLHLYHGYLGASALVERGSLCCYDPAFQAGYPKTPVFDSGSRPAELFLALVGGQFRPEAYKVGLALCCCLVPVLLLTAARGVGLDRGWSCLAVILGLQVWWGEPCREMLEAGDLDLLLAAVAALANVGLLARFDRSPGFLTWAGLFLTAAIGWFTHPVLFAMLFLFSLVYYLSVGARHPFAWHVALVGSLGGALAINGFWLLDWISSWWIRLPIEFEVDEPPRRTFQTLWEASFWGGPLDRALAVVLLGLAVLGLVVLNETRQRPAARLLGLGTGVFLGLALAGHVGTPLTRLGTSLLFVPALLFAVVPAVAALAGTDRLAQRLTRKTWGGLALGGLGLLALGFMGQGYFGTLAVRCSRTIPLIIGLGPEREAPIEALKANTDSTARILWEDRPEPRESSHWTVLLPHWTDRAFIGGLDPTASIEHAKIGLIGQTLAERPLADWSESELDYFCRRYNIGWVVCRSPESLARFQTLAEATSSLGDEERGWLLTLRPRSFVLKGKASVLHADSQRISLADVEPEDGVVVLSFHYHPGLRASHARVQVEGEPDPFDLIPFIRLRVPGPVSRVSLTWENP